MNVLIASDKFKGSLSASEVCVSTAKGVRSAIPNAAITQLPMADGGEGSLDVLIDALDLEYKELTVQDPLFREIQAGYGKKGSVAYIEMALSSGLQLLSPEERSARLTSTIGVGQLMSDALWDGVNQIFLFVGGSATNDGGAGMLQGLGFQLLDKSGNELPGTGEFLPEIEKIIPPSNLPEFELIIVTDVQNKLLGPKGASHHYGPQKGATKADIEWLEAGLTHFSKLISESIGLDVSQVPGSGAAGGIAVAGIGVLGAKIQKGISTFLEITNFEKHAANADLVITGEGKLDSQTLQGKVIDGVAKAATKHNKTVLALCGICEIDQTEWAGVGISEVIQLKTPELSIAYCMENAAELIVQNIDNYLRSGHK